MKTTAKDHILFLVALGLIFWFETLYKQPLYDYSHEFIISLQESRTPFFDFLFTWLASLGDGIVYALIFLHVLNKDGKTRGFYYLLFFIVCLAFQNITKMAYHDPRPYMTDDRIIPMKCSHEYGNPSGHSLFAAAFATFIFIDYYHSEVKKEYSTLSYSLGLFSTVSFILLMGFDRLYTSVHSIDQVLLGF